MTQGNRIEARSVRAAAFGLAEASLVIIPGVFKIIPPEIPEFFSAHPSAAAIALPSLIVLSAMLLARSAANGLKAGQLYANADKYYREEAERRNNPRRSARIGYWATRLYMPLDLIHPSSSRRTL